MVAVRGASVAWRSCRGGGDKEHADGFPIVLSIELETHLLTSQLTSQARCPPSETSIRVSYVVSRQIEVPKGFRTANQGLPDRRG